MKTIPPILSHIPLFLCLVLAACSTTGSAVEIAERQWQQQAISNYRIEVLVVNSIWHAQTHTNWPTFT